ncbi:PhzF family phenazine biosynthesis protein [uncultured Eubacterium sp.]|uniref:PhzF family phenazine biosynthesis protein n=1 Tax=uncultured Eubacterium sp. TaxID=165185 RepID=UPI0025F3E31C|nr:PhzF family phenazine biosynthesis protein [uncultured Eubacterium sp.]
MRVNVVNGFSDHPEGGNPAGVVYLSEELCAKEKGQQPESGDKKPECLTDIQMQKVASELHFSETAFITRLNDRSFAIRYFTPAAEVPLCGHATIASFSYLYQKGVIDDGVYELVTMEAQLTVEVSEGIIWMEMDAPELQQKLEPEMVRRICAAYELDTEALDETLEVRIVKSGLRDIHVCVRSREDLLRAVQHEEEICRISEDLDVVGVHMSCLNLQNTEQITAYCSNYAPLYEIPEECATGTSNGGLTYYLYQKGIIQVDQVNCFLQGEHMNRPSKVYTKVRMEEGRPTVWVGGCGVICREGMDLKA